ncbi:MAG: 8-amino-7-oxononanoate synthase [Candidatus Omnitrophica bacterium]|nr:8-amino-7-oxononanoate synthase [Candidatus Omnitrophota bacterium]
MNSIFQEEIESVKAKHLYRQLRTLEPLDAVHATWQGQKLTLFCGNDYLGLSQDPRVKKAFGDALDETGAGAGASRLISGTTKDHIQLEEKIAAAKEKEAALVFSAGYLANLGVLSTLAGPKDLIVLDKLCHASLIDGARLSGASLRVFAHKNYLRCEEILKSASGFQKRILVSDTVFSMDGDLADFEALIRLKEIYDCLLILDDAHGSGVLGATGKGALEGTGLASRIDVMTGTLSKAYGCLGGFAATSKELKDYLVNFSRPFIFATALPPVLAHAAFEAMQIADEDVSLRQKLWRNMRQLSPHALSPILPVLIGDEKKALEISEELLGEGILAPAIRTPTVAKGKARLRISLSAAHEIEEMDHLKEFFFKKGYSFDSSAKEPR